MFKSLFKYLLKFTISIHTRMANTEGSETPSTWSTPTKFELSQYEPMGSYQGQGQAMMAGGEEAKNEGVARNLKRKFVPEGGYGQGDYGSEDTDTEEDEEVVTKKMKMDDEWLTNGALMFEMREMRKEIKAVKEQLDEIIKIIKK